MISFPEQWVFLVLAMIASPALASLLTNLYNRGQVKATTNLLREQLEEGLRSRIAAQDTRIDDLAGSLQECREARRIAEEVNSRWQLDNRKLELRLEQKDLRIAKLEQTLADHITHRHDGK